MSTAPVIEVANLGKRYRISHQRSRGDDGLRHALNAALTAPLRTLRNRRREHTQVEDFWALNGVNFSVRQGDVLGVIGRNGAGKSTLLKLLSEITEPTTGRIHLRGRVASLLEVGTGFHPELTGRENIYLNGAILGMTKAEIVRKFDEIVDFSEVEQFLDTPVKRYSSGMYVRLAFAVAAHLEPEVLVVDEVLAVGDADFQKKCLGKMGDVSRQGRTVLFVSHNMLAVAKLCTRGIVLDKGVVAFDGGATEAVARYQIGSTEAASHEDLERERRAFGTTQVRFVDWQLVDGSLGLPHTCYSRDQCTFRFTFVCRRPLERVHFGFNIRSSDDTLLVAGHSQENRSTPPGVRVGDHYVDWQLKVPLKPGLYRLEVAAHEEMAPGRGDTWHPSQRLEVLESRFSVIPEGARGVLSEPVEFSLKSADSPDGDR